MAAEDAEDALKGLPEVKNTKYIEVCRSIARCAPELYEKSLNIPLLLQIGRYEMEVWYQSPYPEEFTSQPKIFICEFCLKYMRSSSQVSTHSHSTL